MFKRLNNKKDGFTLIELMIVIAIIGVLAAIAIPQFSAYRKRSYNAASESDLRNACTTQEAYFVDEQTYSANIAQIQISTYGLFISQNVSASVLAASIGGYEMGSVHSAGQKTWGITRPGGPITGCPACL